MYIVLDKFQKELGVMRPEKFKNFICEMVKSFDETKKNLTPDHVFYSDDLKPTSMDSFMKNLDQEIVNKYIDVVEFFDEHKNIYDKAGIFMEEHRERYDTIKKIKNLNEFFKYRNKKERN